MEKKGEQLAPLFGPRIGPIELVKIAAEELSKISPMQKDPPRIGVCGIFFDHGTGQINYCTFNIGNTDVAFSRLHDLSQFLKQLQAQEMAKQAQGRIAIPGQGM